MSLEPQHWSLVNTDILESWADLAKWVQCCKYEKKENGSRNIGQVCSTYPELLFFLSSPSSPGKSHVYIVTPGGPATTWAVEIFAVCFSIQLSEAAATNVHSEQILRAPGCAPSRCWSSQYPNIRLLTSHPWTMSNISGLIHVNVKQPRLISTFEWMSKHPASSYTGSQSPYTSRWPSSSCDWADTNVEIEMAIWILPVNCNEMKGNRSLTFHPFKGWKRLVTRNYRGSLPVKST